MGIEVDWEFFLAQLPSGWRELAVESGLIQPQPPQLNAKVTDIEPVLRLILHRAGLEASLKMTTGEAAAAELINLSSVALHKWERKLAPYLASLSAQMSDASQHFAPPRWSGYDVFVVDGSTVTRPASKGTTARLHYVLRLATLDFVRSIVTDEHDGETLRLHEQVAAPDQLWVADRVYANPPGIGAIVSKGAAVLVRYNRGALPLYDIQGERFDVLGHVRTVQTAGASDEWRVWVHPPQGAPIRGRLCAVRLPDDKVEEARERLRREYGQHASAEGLEAAAWMMVFTTVPRSRMKVRRVLELYRARWQVELELKRDKSIGGLDMLPNFRDDTITTWLQAKLLLQHVAKKITSQAKAVPPPPPDGTSERSPPSPRAPGRPLAQMVAGEAWRVMTLAYDAIRAALRFVPLHEIPARLRYFLAHIRRSNDQTRPKQIEIFQQELRPAPG